MPQYKYTAMNANSKTIKGNITAENETALYEKLRGDSAQLLTFSVVAENAIEFRKFPVAYIAEMCRQLAVMLSSGIPLARSITIFAASEGLKPMQKRSCEAILSSIYKGDSLSAAMESQGDAFPSLLINMIKSAETGGDLAGTMNQMADYYESNSRLRKKISGATTYPKLLLVILIVAVAGILIFIVPQFDSVFAMLDELPAITAFVLSISNFVQNRWYLALGIVAAAAVLFNLLSRVTQVKIFFDRLLLRIPIAGRLMKTIYTANFATSLNSLYGSGIAIPTALQLSRHNIGNAYIDSQFDGVISQLRQGIPLSKAIGTVDGFDKKLSEIINVGEEAGKLGEMLASIAKRLEYETEVAIDKLIKLAEPVMIILIAIVVGVIMIAVMLPIFNVYGAIEQSAQY